MKEIRLQGKASKCWGGKKLGCVKGKDARTPQEDLTLRSVPSEGTDNLGSGLLCSFFSQEFYSRKLSLAFTWSTPLPHSQLNQVYELGLFRRCLFCALRQTFYKGPLPPVNCKCSCLPVDPRPPTLAALLSPPCLTQGWPGPGSFQWHKCNRLI